MRALPLAQIARPDPLVVLAAFLGFVATLALSGALGAHALAAYWAAGLNGQATVELPAGADPAPALEVLTAHAGVAAARALPPEEVAGLVAPWLGQGGGIAGLPLPRLIAVDLAPGADTGAIAAALPPGARLEAHEAWLADTLRLARALNALALGVLAAIVLAGLCAVAATTRARLSICAREVELLHALGATDGQIVAQFVRQAAGACALGGAAGAALGAVALTAASWAAPQMAVPALAPALAVPLASLALGAAMAYAIVARHLREMP
jgi:cell division transport system permease protein